MQIRTTEILQIPTSIFYFFLDRKVVSSIFYLTSPAYYKFKSTHLQLKIEI